MDELMAQRRVPKCARCTNHGVDMDLKGHKRYCHYKQCHCAKCRLVHLRQVVMARQVALRRRQKEDHDREVKSTQSHPSPPPGGTVADSTGVDSTVNEHESVAGRLSVDATVVDEDSIAKTKDGEGKNKLRTLHGDNILNSPVSGPSTNVVNHTAWDQNAKSGKTSDNFTYSIPHVPPQAIRYSLSPSSRGVDCIIPGLAGDIGIRPLGYPSLAQRIPLSTMTSDNFQTVEMMPGAVMIPRTLESSHLNGYGLSTALLGESSIAKNDVRRALHGDDQANHVTAVPSTELANPSAWNINTGFCQTCKGYSYSIPTAALHYTLASPAQRVDTLVPAFTGTAGNSGIRPLCYPSLGQSLPLSAVPRAGDFPATELRNY